MMIVKAGNGTMSVSVAAGKKVDKNSEIILGGTDTHRSMAVIHPNRSGEIHFQRYIMGSWVTFNSKEHTAEELREILLVSGIKI